MSLKRRVGRCINVLWNENYLMYGNKVNVFIGVRARMHGLQRLRLCALGSDVCWNVLQ